MRYVFYVNVGDLPAAKATAYLTELKAAHKWFFGDHDVVLYVAVRHEPTRVEKLEE